MVIPLPTSPLALRLLQGMCYTWAGLVAGISFLEAPVKFAAPSLTRPVGLDVGRHVFGALNRVEVAIGLGGLGLLLFGRPGETVHWTAAAVGGILLVQTAWLLPALRRQAAAIIAGKEAHVSEYVHLGYVFLEAAKIFALVFVGWAVGP